MNARFGALGLFAAMLALVAGCGGDSASVDATVDASRASAVIGAAGGTLTGPDGVQVVIPPSALSQPTTIGIARASSGAPAPLQQGNAPAGPVYEFTPHDLVFNVPVTVRLPLAANAVAGEVFFASQGQGWEVKGATATKDFAEVQRNSFSFGLVASSCAAPPGELYPCSYPKGSATVNATPASALTRVAFGNWQESAGSWVVSQPATVRMTLHYQAAPDCSDTNGGQGSGRVKLIRWNPAVSPRVVTTLFEQTVSLTTTQSSPPPGTFSYGPSPSAQRGVGTTTVDVTAHLGDATNAFAFSFHCQRPGKSMSGGGDLVTILGPMTPPVTRTVGGTVSGLTAAGLVLTNNGGDDVTVAANAGSFTFATAVPTGGDYNVAVRSQPTGLTCVVQNGSGAANANVTNVAVSCTAVARALSKFAYVARNDGTLMTFSIDPVTGALSSVGNLDLGPSLRSVTVDPSGKFVYATKNTGQVFAFKISAATGALAGVAGSPYSTGNFPIAVVVDTTGRFAYVANFGSNDVSVFAINATTGALAAVGAVPAGSNPSSVTVHPSGKFAYVTNAGSASVSAYAIDGSTGALTSVPGSPFAAETDPNAVTIEPSGRFAYVVNRGSNSVSVFGINATTGALTAVGAAVPSGTQPQSAAADPSGKFVYVSNLASANVSAYAINTTTGALSPVGAPVAAAADAYSVAVEAGGKFAYVANFGAGNVSAYSINASTGALTAVASAPFAAGAQPISIATTTGP